MNSEQEGDEIALTVKNTLGYFVEEYKPKNITFPVMNSTYALWRKYAYKQVQQLQFFKQSPEEAKYKFHLLSECHYFKLFLQKVISRLSTQLTTMESTKPINQAMLVDKQIIKKYNKALELHALYQEFLEDIVNIPYLDDIFTEDKKYQLREQFFPDIVGTKEQKFAEKVKTGLFKKGFGIFAEKFLTKTFVLQASTLAISFNPLSMAASYAFSEILSRYRKEKQGEKLLQELTEAVVDTEKKAQQLNSLYTELTELLGKAIKGGEEARETFLKEFRSVLIQDWLSIEKAQDDDGWEIVELHDSNQFDVLQNQQE